MSAVERAPGSRPPPCGQPPGHLHPAPRRRRGSSSSSAPEATAGEAARSEGSKPPLPGPTPPPCRPREPTLAVPPERTGPRGEGANPYGGALRALPGRPRGPPPTAAGRPGGPEAGGPRALPSRRFQALLTLFSESFSSFPRGTCSLSVSRPCLALGGAYHPLGTAFPSSPTLGADDVRSPGGETAGTPTSASRTGLSPSAAPRPRGFREAGAWGGSPRRRPARLQFGAPLGARIGGLGSSRFARRY